MFAMAAERAPIVKTVEPATCGNGSPRSFRRMPNAGVSLFVASMNVAFCQNKKYRCAIGSTAAGSQVKS